MHRRPSVFFDDLHWTWKHIATLLAGVVVALGLWWEVNAQVQTNTTGVLDVRQQQAADAVELKQDLDELKDDLDELKDVVGAQGAAVGRIDERTISILRTLNTLNRALGPPFRNE